MISLIALLPMVLATPVPKDLESQLHWRLAKGDIFYVSFEDKSTGTVAAALPGGSPPTPTQSSTSTNMVFKYEVLAADQNTRVIKVTFLKCLISIGVGDGAANSNSLDVNGANLTLTLDATLAVTKVEGFKEFREKFGGKTSSSLFGAVSSEKGFVEGLRQVFAVIPPQGTATGTRWEQKASYTMGSMGSLDRNVKCTSLELRNENSQVVISTLANYVWSAPDEKMESKANEPQVVSSDLKAEKCKGTVTFDPKRGRLITSQEDIPFSGNLKIQLGDTTINMSMEMKLQRSMSVTETQPK